MTIMADTREHIKQWERIRAGFEAQGVDYIRTKLFVGDYMDMDNPRLVVDRKHDLGEVAKNFTEERKVNGRMRNRLEDEMVRAKEHGIKIVFLIEHGGSMKTIENVMLWKNPRLKTQPLAMTGPRMYRRMLAYQNLYGVEFRFCGKQQTARRIIEILEEGQHGEG